MNESSFELGGGGGRRRQCWRWRGIVKAFDLRILKPTFKSGRSSVMMWGSIIYRFIGPMSILNEGRITVTKYITIVSIPHLIPF